MKWLLIHGWQWDPALDSLPKQWLPEEMDRLTLAINWGPFNKLRAAIAHVSETNADLIAGARKLGYPTICGHSHIPESQDIFRNCGSWCGTYQPHYVRFPKDKIAVISDLHIGAPEAKAYEPMLMAFLTFAKTQGWTIWSIGDTCDLWAHSEKDIGVSCGEVLTAIANYRDFHVIGGNHDNKLQSLGNLVGLPPPIPWYAFIDTDDKPELLGWPT